MPVVSTSAAPGKGKGPCRVYVLERQRRLFGAHCPVRWRAAERAIEGPSPPEGPSEYRSHVFGFSDPRHARLMAAALDGHYRRHGRFPESDVGVPGPDTLFRALRPEDARLDVVEPASLDIVELSLSELLLRLRGTGVVVTLLHPTEGGTLGRKTVAPDLTTSAVREALAAAWAASEPAGELLPKPAWPPLPPKRRPVPTLARAALRRGGTLSAEVSFLFEYYVSLIEFCVAVTTFDARVTTVLFKLLIGRLF